MLELVDQSTAEAGGERVHPIRAIQRDRQHSVVAPAGSKIHARTVPPVVNGTLTCVDPTPDRFARQLGQVPRATVACYAAAILHATLSVAVGLFGGSGRTMAYGIVAAVFGAVLWVAIGTGLSLLSQIADRRSS